MKSQKFVIFFIYNFLDFPAAALVATVSGAAFFPFRFECVCRVVELMIAGSGFCCEKLENIVILI